MSGASVEQPADDEEPPPLVTQPPDNEQVVLDAPAAAAAAAAAARQPRGVVVPAAASSRGASSAGAASEGGATVRERNAGMLFNEMMADVHFVVGPPGGTERLAAHAYVLATGSSVFYAMFFGGFPTSGDVSVPDVEPTAFRILLKYLYTDEVDVDADTVLPTLYVAKKYLVAHLTRACIDFLDTSLTAKNVCLLLAQGRLFAEDQLMQRCWQLMDAQAELALESDGLVDVDWDTLAAIVGRDTLHVRESAVFHAALRWAAAQCDRQGLDASVPSNLRSVLGSVFENIRIPSMSIEEFANGPARSGLLDYAETTNVFLWFTAEQKPAVNFNCRPRAGLRLQRCHRFQSSAYRSNQWRYRGRCDSIQFCADRRIFVAGLGLYGSSNGAAEYGVRVELKRGGQTLADLRTRFFSDGSSSTFAVLFAEPVQVEANAWCTASAVLDGQELSYFGQEGVAEAQAGRVNFLFQCSTESTNGTGVQGGQIPEILFYG